MLVDTHCHINMMVKKEFDVALTHEQLLSAESIIQEARAHDVTRIIHVGTSLIESRNCVELAKKYADTYAAVGIHPNDCASSWREDMKEIIALVKNKEKNKIVGIGECGIDKHYPDYDLQRQKDAFRMQIELALEYDLGLVVHSRDAYDETLSCIDEYRGEKVRGIIHCFSEDQAFADFAINLGYVIGLGGTITYPKNNDLRTIACTIPLESIVLETDAPFLPPQIMRSKQNNPKYIALIAQFLADLRSVPRDVIAEQTTKNARRVFKLEE